KGLLRRADLVLHTCHVPLCVNPDHLYRGSHARNMRDRNQARRQARGERHGHAKLTAAQVTAIRAATGTPTEIGRRFGLSRSHVANIRAGRIWSDAA
ncbi:MAG: HNH endonuclease, partial [Dehalococcoidia bacterium]